MSTVFESIIAGDIPGNFVWADGQCVVVTTHAPVAPGHVLVIPREPIDKWTDLPPQLLSHLFAVSQTVGTAQEKAFGKQRSAVIIAGFEVPHAHIHLVPADSERDLAISSAAVADPGEVTAAAELLRATLREQGYEAQVPVEVSSPRLG